MKRWRGSSGNAQRILTGYVIVLVFFIVFSVLAVLGSNHLSRILGETSVLLLLSLIAILPPLVEFLRPVVTTVKAGIFEISFREIADETKAVIEYLEPSAYDVKEQLPFMARDGWIEILRELDRFNESNAELVILDLGTPSKRIWKFPNLYFLALLLELRSGVRQLLFLQQRDGGYNEFVTMCTPEHLRQDLEKLFPIFGAAAAKWKEAQAQHQTQVQASGTSVQIPVPQNIAFDDAFNNASQEASMQLSDPANTSGDRGTQLAGLDGWVEPRGLYRVLDFHVNLCRIQWKERLTREDYEAILCCNDSYVAVVRDSSYISVLDRDRVALALARNVASSS
jgi:hypothetical protein